MKFEKTSTRMLTLAIVSVVIGLSAFSQTASAMRRLPALIGDCWSENAMDIADGEFIVNLETKLISKAKLLKAMSALNGRNIEPTAYPVVFDQSTFVHVRAVDYSRPSLTREELKGAVRAELEDVVLLSRGISAACNHISYPAVGVGERK